MILIGWKELRRLRSGDDAKRTLVMEKERGKRNRETERSGERERERERENKRKRETMQFTIQTKSHHALPSCGDMLTAHAFSHIFTSHCLRTLLPLPKVLALGGPCNNLRMLWGLAANSGIPHASGLAVQVRAHRPILLSSRHPRFRPPLLPSCVGKKQMWLCPGLVRQCGGDSLDTAAQA